MAVAPPPPARTLITSLDMVDAPPNPPASSSPPPDLETAASDDTTLNLDDPADLAKLERTIAALASLDVGTLAHSRFRAVRRALEPLHKRFVDRQAAILDLERKRQLRNEREKRQKSQAKADRRHKDTTRLRLERIRNLAELCESGGGGVGGDVLGNLLGDAPVAYLSQVPDGAVREDDARGEKRGRDVALALEAAADEDEGDDGGAEGRPERDAGAGRSAEDDSSAPPPSSTSAPPPSSTSAPPSHSELNRASQCYTCKARFTTLHHFYAQLCPSCAEVNYRMRHLSADLTGRTALLTGARVKIGFEIGLKLLRAGATLIATTRFPADAAARYAREKDYDEWKRRLHVHAVDLRDVAGLEAFCARLLETTPRLDVIVNNACQTVRRPASYYAHLLPAERRLEEALRSRGRPSLEASAVAGSSAAVAGSSAASSESSAEIAPTLANHAMFSSSRPRPDASASGALLAGDAQRDGDRDPDEFFPTPAQLSQMKIAPEDFVTAPEHLPEGKLDVNGQQIDLRSSNSWLLKLQEVSLPELVEVMAINAIAPFVLNARLQPLLARTAATYDVDTFIVNVSAMEGKFYRHKTPNHPHTNMAKAALNMMTRTAAAELAEKHRVFMTAVDTGWINDENPRERAARIARDHHFQTPLDEIDAAARVLHPVFHGAAGGTTPLRGVFLKDFIATEW